MDIDIVYIWCDNADEKWRNKRQETAAHYGVLPKGDANGESRYRTNDDLRYSLRSVEKYAPWLRKVFLAIDDDATPPHWLNERHPKLHIVRHSQIMPKECMPCFCSDNIEHSVGGIQGLAERFLLANDDTLFYRPLDSSFFYAKDGYPICRVCGKYCPPEKHFVDNYTLNLQHTMDLFVARHLSIDCAAAKAMRRLPHHNIDAYCKSDVLITREMYGKEIDVQMRYPFRKADNVQRVIYMYEALQRKHGHLRLSSFNTSPYGWLRRLLPCWADSLFFVNDLWLKSPNMLKRFNPGLICYNDTADTKDTSRVWLKQQYQNLFPTPCKFERN